MSFILIGVSTELTRKITNMAERFSILKSLPLYIFAQ